MPAKERQRHDELIKQLYVNEGRSIGDVCNIVNREFNLTASERSYKYCIRRLNLKRNAIAKERQKVVRYIKSLQYTVGKYESRIRVRIRGHNIATPKLSRWLKDDSLHQQPVLLGSLSPLPSDISISLCESPKSASSVLLGGQLPENESASTAEWERGVIQRLKKYAGYENPTLDPHEARVVLNDLQLILSCDDVVEDSCSYKRDTIVDEYTIQVHKLMNGSIMNREWAGAIIDQHPLKTTCQLQAGRRVSAAQRTRYGFVEITFWIFPKDSYLNFSNEGFGTSRVDVARIAIVPRETAKFRITVDLTPHPNLPARITYQRMVPNESKVFRVVESGDVEALTQAIGEGIASLEDRDEQGRPLLYYAALTSIVEMCQFLIRHAADVNELVEVERVVRPIYSLTLPIFINSVNDEHGQMSHCFKIMLEAGADLSLKASAYSSRNTIFYLGMLCGSLESFEHMINLGQQFICLEEFYEVIEGKKRYPLHLLAEQCGYSLNFESVDIVEKAILLLKHGANISYPDYEGSVLHTTIGCVRYHQYGSKRQARSLDRVRQWAHSFHEPKEFLIACIAAGADVYAINHEGLTPSMYARLFGREKEWLEALWSTEQDPEEVVAHSDPNFHHCRERSASKLSLEGYCLRREQDLKVRQSDIADDDEEMSDDVAELSYDESYLSDTSTCGNSEAEEDESVNRCQNCHMRLDDDGILDHYRPLLMEMGKNQMPRHVQ